MILQCEKAVRAAADQTFLCFVLISFYPTGKKPPFLVVNITANNYVHAQDSNSTPKGDRMSTC